MYFLAAEWKHLLLATYPVNREVLEPFVPEGTRIDTFDGQVLISLVAFLFDQTRIVGMPIPFHRRFEEVNLRFYVTPQGDPTIRAVSFIKEIVPRGAIAVVANNLFHENYVVRPMHHGNEAKRHWYTWTDGACQQFSATIESEPAYPVPGSIGEFITEHYWGYSRGRGRTLAYRVRHPRWKCCELKEFRIDVDFGKTYGDTFSFLNGRKPYIVQYAEGSPVTVSFPKRLGRRMSQGNESDERSRS